ncbi:MAG: flagellar protein FlaG [Candidatus Latescibacterota bacterium]
MTQGIGSLKGAGAPPSAPTRVAPGARRGGQSVQGAAPVGQGEDGGQRAPVAPPAGGDLKALAVELNQALKQINGRFSASVDDATGMVVVRITDLDTGELVKQVPPQQVLDASVSMEKIIGLLVNDQA